MKIQFPISDFQLPVEKKAARPTAANRQSAIGNRQSRRGVALIITLIMLAVVTFMALTFLAISRRERGAVATTTDQNTADSAAAAALASAEAQIMANTLATTNPYNFGLLVSTNYINSYGFVSGIANPTNVNYYYRDPVAGLSGTNPVSGDDFLQLLANLYYSPRPPVFIPTNSLGSNDFRFYLDLNHNGYFETNGWVTDASGSSTNVGDPEWVGVLQHPDQPYGPNNPFVARYAFIAVPIGNALDLNAIHNQAYTRTLTNSSDGFLRNQGVGSWEINLAAFLADLNYNEWLPVLPPDNRYYAYNPPPAVGGNKGIAFEDALALLSYRYGYNYKSLAPVGGPQGLFTNTFVFPPFQKNIDAYSDGPLMTTLDGTNWLQNVTWPWAGADNPTNFFNLQELFDPNKTSPAFTNRLLAVGDAFDPTSDNYTNFYNRYTYYRLLSQMGVESAPEQDQINLNYSNAVAYTNLFGVVTNVAIFPNAETNFVSWTDPLQFFLIAADRMLRAYSQEWLTENPTNYLATYGVTTNISTAVNPILDPTNVPAPFGITNIPVYVNGNFVYTTAIQRVLQLAANMYDTIYYYSNNFALGGVNSAGVAYPDAYLPSVFRPFFSVVLTPPPPAVPQYTNVYISGFTQVTNIYQVDFHPVGYPFTGTPLTTPYNLNNPNIMASLLTQGPGPYYINVFGVPWIIGAKKGFPNFNEFAMDNAFQITRKLEVTRSNTNSTWSLNPTDFHFYEMFNLSFSNLFGVECWNSYTNNYTRPVDISVTNYLSVTLINDENFRFTTNFVVSGFLQFPNLANSNYTFWPGYNPNGNVAAVFLTPASFQIPLATNCGAVPVSTYRFNGGAPFLAPPTLDFETGPTGYGTLPQPHWWLMMTNNLQGIMVDDATRKLIDYVQLAGSNSIRDLTGEIRSHDTNGFWDPARVNANAAPNGINQQIADSKTYITNLWAGQDPKTVLDQLNGFLVFLNGAKTTLLTYPGYVPDPTTMSQAAATNQYQVPYTPTATAVEHIDWQANDPLVHYTVGDLSGAPDNGVLNQYVTTTGINLNGVNLPENLGLLNDRYMPWGGNPNNSADSNPYNLALKDPLVWRSDDWDFPTNKFPTVGWLGRVHRGTPWQTVYMKSPLVSLATWTNWTADAISSGFDAFNSEPAQDRLLFDLFTTAFNDNATRGQLSVNVGASEPNNPQAGLAAWSALFSGVEVLSNSAIDPDIQTNIIIQHASSIANYSAFPVDPAGPAGMSSAPGQIVASINRTRASFTNVDGLAGSFEHVGDILSVPQLSDGSLFLHLSNYVDNTWVEDAAQKDNGISDEMYEWLPQQVMSLLRVSGTPQSPMRYVIYSYGQALKPAPNGIYTGSGQFFGMVTNYQVVAEAASRAVVNFNSVVTDVASTNDINGNLYLLPKGVPVLTNNNAVIKRYNVLPPD